MVVFALIIITVIVLVFYYGLGSSENSDVVNEELVDGVCVAKCDCTADECVCEPGYLGPGLRGTWSGYTCMNKVQNFPIQSDKPPVCTNYGSFWYAHVPDSSDPYQCFIGDDHGGKTIGDSGIYFDGDRCMTGLGQSGCEQTLSNINC